MITTTLKRIRKHHPCKVGWETILEGLGKTKADAEPLPFARIVEINGFHDALWCCRVEPQYAREWRLFAVWCVRQVPHLIMDPTAVAVLDVAERYAWGKATDKELDAARTDASDAYVAGAVYATTGDAAAAVVYAADAAPATAAMIASSAVRRPAAVRAASDAARAAVRSAQTKEFWRIVTETENRT